MSEPITPNMSLLQPITGVTSGSTANDDFNANWTTIDQHDHSPGKGVQITPSSFNINSDLLFNGNNATLLRSARFSAQASALSGASDLACLYFSGVDLWANDASGNQIQITSGGGVNATSSGISSGTATASFVSSVLVVNAASNKPANIQGASLLLGNNVTGSHYLTLAPPNAMGADYGLVLPAIPAVKSIMAIDTSGNMTGAYTVDNSTIDINGSSQIEIKALGVGTAQIAALAVTAAKIANNTITASQIANATITGTQITSSVNLPGNTAQENGNNLVVSSTNAATSLKIIRGHVQTGVPPTIIAGEGFTVVRNSLGTYTLTWSSAFASEPVVTYSIFNSSTHIVTGVTEGTSTAVLQTSNLSGSANDSDFTFIAIGPR